MATLSVDPKIVTLSEPGSAEAEAFRMIRANLHFAGMARPLRSVLVTSAAPGEGKTLVAANLAVAAAGTGQRVLLLDADLRLPAAQKSFGIDPLPGLTRVLLGHAPLEQAVVEVLDGLAVCPAGMPPPNPAELMASPALPRVLEEAGRLADLVIVDGPPLLPVADASLLAVAVDGVVLVVTAGKTHAPVARRALAALQRARARVLGVVLARAASMPDGAAYGRYYLPRKGGKHAAQ